MEIKDYRNRIDEIDKTIGALLNERLNACMEIGKLKKEADLAVTDSSREEKVLENATASADSEEHKQAIRGIYNKIFEESKRVQKWN